MGRGEEILPIFATPLYNKIAFLRPPYTKKCHFRDPPIQQNGIFETPLYKKMPFLRPPIHQNAIFETPLYKKLAFLRTPYTKKVPSSPTLPIFKWNSPKCIFLTTLSYI